MEINNQIEMVCDNCGNVQATRDMYLLGESSVNYSSHPNEVAICCDNPYYVRKEMMRKKMTDKKTLQEYYFKSTHSILADSEEEAREILMTQSEDFTRNAVVFKVIDWSKRKEEQTV